MDELIESLGVSRSAISGAYLVGTLLAAAALPSIGYRIDRVGVSRAMTAVGLAFGASLILLGGAHGLIMLALGFVGIRMLGQGALSLVGQTGIALWFDRKRGLAIGISTVAAGVIMATSPLVFSLLIDLVGWRWAWVVLGIGIWVTVVPIGRFAMVDRPSDIGQLPDGAVAAADSEAHPEQASFTSRQAVRTPAFWTVSATVALTACLVTGLTFHHLAIMAARGLDRTEAATVFIPQMIGASVAGFLFGWLTDRVSPRILLPASGGVLAGALVLATLVQPGALALAYGLVLGVNLGQVQSISTAIYPKWFGTAHIGAIRGIATSVMVAASATGPLVVSAGNDLFGSYGPVLLLSAVGALLVAAVAALVPPPTLPDARDQPESHIRVPH